MTQDKMEPAAPKDPREPRKAPIPLADRRRMVNRANPDVEPTPVFKDWASI